MRQRAVDEQGNVTDYGGVASVVTIRKRSDHRFGTSDRYPTFSGVGSARMPKSSLTDGRTGTKIVNIPSTVSKGMNPISSAATTRQ